MRETSVFGRPTSLAIAVLALSSAVFASPRIEVRATSRLELRSTRVGQTSTVEVRGVLLDDTERPLAGETLHVSVGATRLAEVLSECPGAPGLTLERAHLASTVTDALGQVCFRLAVALPRTDMEVTFAGRGLVDGTQSSLAVDLALRPVTLRFDPEPGVVALDGSPVVVEVVATVDDGRRGPVEGVQLRLSNERGELVGLATTSASGQGQFAFGAMELGTLGPAGPGELRVSFVGSAELSPSVRTARIERRTHVDLEVNEAHLPEGRLPEGSPDDGVRVVVLARERGPGAEASGGVEARVEETVVGAAPLEQGRAGVLVSFASLGRKEALLTFRYVPDAPWRIAGDELRLVLPLRGPSPWKGAAVMAVGFGVLAWLIFERVRPGRTHRVEAAVVAESIEARVERVASTTAVGGWHGTVRDAHDGAAIAGARLAVCRPGFQSSEVVVTAQSDECGEFTFEGLEGRRGDRLVVESEGHTRLERPLPSAGELRVALIARRRALLARLVEWARRAGPPFYVSPEPTPGHVHRVASGRIARWAKAVERAAYGAVPVDSSVEAEVDSLAPREGTATKPASEHER